MQRQRQRNRQRATLTRIIVALMAAMVVLSTVPLPVAAADPEGSDDPTAASSISFGQSVSGTLESDDEDWYEFTAQQGRVITVTAPRPSSEIGGFYVSAYRDDGTGRAVSIGNGDTSDFVSPGVTGVVEFAVPGTGTYYVEIQGDSGTYEVTVTSRQTDAFEPNDTPTDATAYTVGNTQSGELHEGDEDWFEFTAQQGSLVAVTAPRPSGEIGGFYVSAYRDDGTGRAVSIGNGDTSDFVSPGTTGSLEFVIPATGTYYVEIQGDSGTYEVTVTSRQTDAFEPNDTPTDATAYTVGDPQVGELTEGDEDWFEFSATAGQLYQVTAPRPSGEIGGFYVSAYRDDGTGRAVSIGNGDTSDFVSAGTTGVLEFVPAVSGTHYVEIQGDSGSYEFTVTSRQSDTYEPNDAADSAVGLVDNPRGPVTGELHEGDEEWFEIVVRKDQVVNVTATRPSSEVGGFYVSAYRDDGTGRAVSIGNGDTSDFVSAGTTQEIGFRAPATRTYYVEIQGDSGTFSYDLTVDGETLGLPNDQFEPNERAQTAGSIAPGTYDDLAMVDDDEDWFSFRAERGDRIVAVARFAHADNDLALELRNPSGTVVQSGTSSTDDETVDFVATASGTHTLRVTGQADKVGIYSLQVAIVGGVNLAVGPGSANLAPGDSATYDVVLSGVQAGVGPYSFTIESSDTSLVTITAASVPRVSGSVSVASDGSSVDISTTANQSVAGSVVIARVTVEAASGADGSATLRFAGSPTIGTTIGVDYPLSQVQGTDVSVSTGPSAINPRYGPPRDMDGDGLFEDVNGDGRFNVIDVSIFLDEFDRPGVQNQKQFFDFQTDGTINIIDVADLLNRT